jgi:hypothetical protein
MHEQDAAWLALAQGLMMEQPRIRMIRSEKYAADGYIPVRVRRK